DRAQRFAEARAPGLAQVERLLAGLGRERPHEARRLRGLPAAVDAVEDHEHAARVPGAEGNPQGRCRNRASDTLGCVQSAVRVEATSDGRGCFLSVRAQPGARRTGAAGAWNGMLKVTVAAP